MTNRLTDRDIGTNFQGGETGRVSINFDNSEAHDS